MTQETKELTTLAKTDLTQAAGISVDDLEVVQTGGILKWIDLSPFADDENWRSKAFAGVLVGMDSIPMPEGKDREYYLIRLVSPCPVTYRDEDRTNVAEVAQAGEIVALAHRDKLRTLRDMATDGGTYLVVIRPHSKIKIGGGHTMWTFDIARKVIMPPPTKTEDKIPF